MVKFRSTQTFDGIQLTHDNVDEVLAFCKGTKLSERKYDLAIQLEYYPISVRWGEWVIRYRDDEYGIASNLAMEVDFEIIDDK